MKEVIFNLVAWVLITLANLTSWIIVETHHDLMSAVVGFAYIQWVYATLFAMSLIGLYGVATHYRMYQAERNRLVTLTEVWSIDGQTYTRVTHHSSWESVNYRIDLTQALWPEGTEFSADLDDEGNIVLYIIH